MESNLINNIKQNLLSTFILRYYYIYKRLIIRGYVIYVYIYIYIYIQIYIAVFYLVPLGIIKLGRETFETVCFQKDTPTKCA